MKEKIDGLIKKISKDCPVIAKDINEYCNRKEFIGYPPEKQLNRLFQKLNIIRSETKDPKVIEQLNHFKILIESIIQNNPLESKKPPEYKLDFSLIGNISSFEKHKELAKSSKNQDQAMVDFALNPLTIEQKCLNLSLLLHFDDDFFSKFSQNTSLTLYFSNKIISKEHIKTLRPLFGIYLLSELNYEKCLTDLSCSSEYNPIESLGMLHEEFKTLYDNREISPEDILSHCNLIAQQADAGKFLEFLKAKLQDNNIPLAVTHIITDYAYSMKNFTFFFPKPVQKTHLAKEESDKCVLM